MISRAWISNVGGHATGAARRLVHQEAGVRQGQTALLRNRYENQRAGRGGPAGRDYEDLRLDEANHVVDRITGFDMAARRADEHTDVFIRGGSKRDELRADLLRQLHGDAAIDEDRTRLEEVRFRFLADRQFLALVVFVFVHHRGQSSLVWLIRT